VLGVFNQFVEQLQDLAVGGGVQGGSQEYFRLVAHLQRVICNDSLIFQQYLLDYTVTVEDRNPGVVVDLEFIALFSCDHIGSLQLEYFLSPGHDAADCGGCRV